MKKFLGFAAVAFVVFFIARNPAGAASTARGLFSQLGAVASGFSVFVSNLAGGKS